MQHDPTYIREFVTEAREGLDRIDSVLVTLESNPVDRSGLDAIFRLLHTIKGNAGFLELEKIGALAHAGESLLSKLIGGTLTVSGDVTEVLLRLVDALRGMIDEIESKGRAGAEQHKSLIEELNRWTTMAGGGKDEKAGSISPATPILDKSVAIPHTTPATFRLNEQTVTAADVSPVSRVEGTATFIPASDDAAKPTEQHRMVSSNPTPPTPASRETASAEDQLSDSLPLKSESSLVASFVSRGSSEGDQSFIRVQIDHLDELMNLVGELVLTRNRIVQVASGKPDDDLTESIQRLHHLTTALQEGVMRTRMQPVRNAWRKYPRIVRDLAKKCGKKCEVELQGGDTELDKSMLEAIADPLVHLVRNAVDHGIEKPYLRKIKKKPETGRLLVRAFQESGQFHIEVSDDGAGIDLEKVRQKAVAAGIISADRAQIISESDLRNSVFLPGFTTADKVTDLSGRGVGMDVVKTRVEQIGGTIELHTQKDVGTKIRLTVPLTLAIVPAIMVKCGQQRFAIPQINVIEMLRLRGDDQHLARELFHETPVLRLRGELIPMADLCLKLGVGSQCVAAGSSHRETLDILVLKTGTRRFALLVDELGDAQEIVVKPLGELLSNQPEFSGAAMLGDGNIALILDALGIARSTGLVTAEQAMLGSSITIHDELARLDEQVLVCRVNGDRQVAFPLADVVCLEQVDRSMVEHSAAGQVIQYRGDIVPLYPLSDQPQAISESAEGSSLAVVIYRTTESFIGLMVDRIVDVAPRPADLKPVTLTTDSHSRHQVIGSAVVLGRVTDFLQVC